MNESSYVNNHSLSADCKNCFGLCCVALCFSALEGFPVNKEAGEPCLNLQKDFTCCIHKNLLETGLRGCIAFDCFGAGQKVSLVSYRGRDWRSSPEIANQMFKVFMVMQRLHELLWYLTEALKLMTAHQNYEKLTELLIETEELTHLSPNSLIELDLESHRNKVNPLLIETSQLIGSRFTRRTNLRSKKILGGGQDLIGADLRKTDLRGESLRGAYLIAANLRDVDLSGTDLIGADLRDADLRGANLSNSIFLTQAQVNSAKGDNKTKLPESIIPPTHWGS